MEETFKDLCRFVRAEPFEPFVIHLGDGSEHKIRDRRSIYVAHDLVVIGRKPNKHGIFQEAIDIHAPKVRITNVTPLKANGSRRRK